MGNLALAALAFASTNVDDILVLLGFFADPTFRPWQIVLGQYLGFGAIIAASLAGAFATMLVPRAYVGLLGLLPIALGLKKIGENARGDGDPEAVLEEHHPTAAGAATRSLTVATVTVANCGDNIGVYVPMFATRTAPEAASIVIVFLVLTGIWCAIARWLVGHRTLGRPIRRYGHRLLPWVLVGLGLYILKGSLTALLA